MTGVSDPFEYLETSSDQADVLCLTGAPLYGSVGLQNARTSSKACATVKACELPTGYDHSRAPVDIVVALDVSASMQGDKLSLCKKTIGLLLRELSNQDRFGLITFSDEAKIVIPTRSLKTSGRKEAAIDIVNKLSTICSTNISDGIGMALQELQDVEEPNTVRTVFLLTDGLANRGITSAAGIVDLVKRHTASASTEGSPITVHTFGYGADHDQNLLRDISNATDGGSYYFVNNDANVLSAFGDALGGILSVVAQNAVVTIKVPPEAHQRGVRLTEVHHKGKVALDDGSWKVNLGDFYAEESRDVVFELGLASSSARDVVERCDLSEAVPHAEVKLSFMDTLKKTLCTSHSPILISILRPDNDGDSSPNAHVAVQWMRVRATEAMEQAQSRAQEGNLKSARELVSKQLLDLEGNAKEAYVMSDPMILQLKGDLQRILDGFEDRHEYEMSGRHLAAQVGLSHAQQRCNESSFSSSNIYRTNIKTKKAGWFSSSFQK